MKEIYIKRKRLHGNISELVRCQVLSQTGDMLRVVPEGSQKPVEVKASETVPMNKMSGLKDNVTLVPKQYPTASGAMHNRLPK